MTTGQLRQAATSATSAPARHALSKVPEVTVYFWITKVLTTGMGETASDFLVRTLGNVVAVGLGGIALVLALAMQLRADRYVAWIYWTAVVMVSVFGTMIADVIHVGFGVPYVVSTVAFMIALAAIFVVWYRSEGTLSIHSIHTRRREYYYWLTVMATFALGTAAGDMTATTMHLGYYSSGVMFAAVIAVPALAHWKAGLNAVVAFWFAYIVTRPLGASVADWMALPHHRGGLQWGLGPVTVIWTVLILGLVAYLAATRMDVERA